MIPSSHIATFSPPQCSLSSLNMDNNSLSQSMDSVNTAVSVTGEEEVRDSCKIAFLQSEFLKRVRENICVKFNTAAEYLVTTSVCA